MRILIDADGCPVVDITIITAAEFGIEVIILCDTSHIFNKPNVKTITVSKGADSVDFALVNMLTKSDIVVTQDYGLAAMCLARNAAALNQDGIIYSDENMDALLSVRHTAKKLRSSPRRSGVNGRLKGPSKRSADNDADFEAGLRQLIKLMSH